MGRRCCAEPPRGPGCGAGSETPVSGTRWKCEPLPGTGLSWAGLCPLCRLGRCPAALCARVTPCTLGSTAAGLQPQRCGQCWAAGCPLASASWRHAGLWNGLCWCPALGGLAGVEMHWRGGVGVDVVGTGCKMGVPRLALQPVPPCAEHRDRQVTCLRSERLVRGLGSVMGLRGKEDQALSLLLGVTLVLCRVSSTSCIPVPLPWLAVCCPVLVRQPGSSLTRSRTRNEAAGQETTLLSSFAAWWRGVESAQTTAGSHCQVPLMLSDGCSPQATSPAGKKPLLSPILLTLPVTCVPSCQCSAGMVLWQFSNASYRDVLCHRVLGWCAPADGLHGVLLPPLHRGKSRPPNLLGKQPDTEVAIPFGSVWKHPPSKSNRLARQ